MTSPEGIALTSKEEAFVQARLNHPGLSLRKIAEKIEVSFSTAARYSVSPQVKAAIEAEYEEAKEAIRLARRKAAGRLAELIDSDREAIALQAVKLVLGEILEKPSAPPGPPPIPETPRSDDDWARIFRVARGLGE